MALSHEYPSAPQPDKYKEHWEATPDVLPLSDSRVQVRLAELAYPSAEKPMMDWLVTKDGDFSLAERFGAYRDASHAEETLEIKDPAKVRAFLEMLSTYPPPTLH